MLASSSFCPIGELSQDGAADPASPRSRAADFETEDVIGALSIFCGGLVMAIDERMPMASEQLFDAVGHSTMMGICCFGEQGMNRHASAIHGDLMYGCLLFSNLDAAGLRADNAVGSS